jgi:hypothetical protein
LVRIAGHSGALRHARMIVDRPESVNDREAQIEPLPARPRDCSRVSERARLRGPYGAEQQISLAHPESTSKERTAGPPSDGPLDRRPTA